MPPRLSDCEIGMSVMFLDKTLTALHVPTDQRATNRERRSYFRERWQSQSLRTFNNAEALLQHSVSYGTPVPSCVQNLQHKSLCSTAACFKQSKFRRLAPVEVHNTATFQGTIRTQARAEHNST
eukprot:4451178-Amphidinium_carterae.1